MSIESNLKKLLKGEKACIPEHFLKVPSYNSPTLRTGKGKPLSEGAFGKMYRGSINDNGRRYVAYKEIDTSESTDGAFEFEFKVAEKLKEFAVPEMYLFKKCPIQYKTPKKVRKKNGTLVQPKERTKPKDILYMELLNGMSFNSWWQTKPSLDAIKSVIVQVFDNLYRINQKFPDFRHRDLHGGNVIVSRREAEYTWKVDLGRKVIRNDPGGSFRSRLGSPDIKKYKRTNAGVEAHIIDFGLSYWSRRMPNPETKDGVYEDIGVYGHGIGPGTIYYDIHRFLYVIYVKVRQPGTLNERAIKNFIEELIPNKEFLEFNGKFTSEGYLLSDYHVALRANLPTFKTILTHPFLTGEKSPNRPKTVTEALKMLPKAKTPPKIKTPKAKTKTASPKLSTTERKKKMNSAIKRAAAALAKPKTKPAPLRRPGAVRPNPVPEIQPASPSPKANAPYGVMSPSNIMEYARKIESGRKKAANKLNAKHKEIKATKGKTPTPVRLKEKFSFVNVKGKKREFVRKFAYDRALAKNKAEREKTKAKTPTPEEAGKEWNKRYKETFGITFKEIPNYVMPPAAHNRHMGMINNRREYVNDRTKGKTPSFGYIATTAERAKEAKAKAKAKAKTPTPKAKTVTPKAKTVTPKVKTPTPKVKTPTPKVKWSNANNKQFMELLAREKNAQRKLANKMNKYVNSLSNNQRNMLKKKIC
jgi:hypothetical protein